MPTVVTETSYDERFEPLALALGHLVVAAALVERALLSDLVARRVIRDGAAAVFEAGLVSDFERKTAGALLRRLRKLGYEAELAARLDAAIEQRNIFIHRLFDDPRFIRSLAGESVEPMCAEIEELVAEFYGLLAHIEPEIS